MNKFIFIILLSFLPEYFFSQDTISDVITERYSDYFPKEFKVCQNRDTFIIKGNDTLKKILFYKSSPFTGVHKLDVGNGTAYFNIYKKGQKIYSNSFQNGILILSVPYKNGKIHGKKIGRNDKGQIIYESVVDQGCEIKYTSYQNGKKQYVQWYKKCKTPDKFGLAHGELKKIKKYSGRRHSN